MKNSRPVWNLCGANGVKNSRHTWNLCGANSEEFKAGVESLWN